MTTEAGPFPSIDLVPKKETRALDFLKKHPDYDGRNVRIGILDTGIFPGAHAVMNQADGAPKLVDVIDCSGSGDVELFDAKAEWKDDCWQVQGLSGRTLKLGEWKMEPFPNSKPKEEEKDGEEKEKTAETTKTAPVRRGIKRAYELFPSKLTSRVKKERKRQFDTKVQAYAAEVRGKLAECTGNAPETVKQRDDLEARLDILTDTTWNDEDPGPIFDCIVFYDGTDYWAAIDVEESGQLQSFKPMTNFRKLRQFGTLGVIDQMNYAINIFDEGTILSIVTDTSPHGTHVAGISAAAEGERSGVAPGAELVSLKIGDTRLNGMETGTSVARAMIEAVRTGCDVINMSYGEGTTVPNSGHFIELAEDLVWKHNVIFVSSAGNNGVSTARCVVGVYGSIIVSCSRNLSVFAAGHFDGWCPRRYFYRHYWRSRVCFT